jgi:dihydrofolate reductase
MLTLDGVLQAPGEPKEDTSNDFKYGGWAAPFSDQVSNEVFKRIMEPTDLLLGRKTFENWEQYWPENASGWPGINEVTKYVLTETRTDSNWENCVFLDSFEKVRELKNSEGKDLKVWGSSKLVQTLLKNDLVDELWLLIYPIVLGQGKTLFDNSALPIAFELVEHIVSSKGIIMCNYRKKGKIDTGTINWE